MTAKAIIFDMDGTLLDTLEDIGLAANRTLRLYNLPEHDLDAYRYFVGRGAEYLVRKCLPQDKLTDSFVAEFLDTFLKDYDSSFDENTRPYDGIPEMLDAVSERNLKISILSNKPDSTTKACADLYLNQWQFANIWGSGEIYPRKPDPKAALKISELTDIAPSDYLFVGDTNIDMKTAVAAGMRPIGVSWGFRPIEELIEAGAGAIVNHPSDLIKLI